MAARLGQRFADEAQIVRGQRPARPGEVFRGVAEAGLQHGEFGFQGGDSARAERTAAAPVVARLEGGRAGRVERVQQPKLISETFTSPVPGGR